MVRREFERQAEGWHARIVEAEREHGGPGVLEGVGVAPSCGICGARLVPA